MSNKMGSIERALMLTNGARFYKCALQVNPHHYSATFRGQVSEGDSAGYVAQILGKARELDIDMLAITDHNSVASVACFREVALNHDIHIFPGFELTSNDGVHILCLYPPDASEEQLERYLGEFGIRDTSPSSDLANKHFVEVLECVHDQGGIAVAAHVTSETGGLFDALSGQARIRAWTDDNLLAVQIPGSVDDLPQDIRSIVKNKNADYIRAPVSGNGLAIAVVNARDILSPDDLEDPSATSWIKMSEVSIEGLRQAFLDPGSRIRLNSAPTPEDHAEFVAITWEGGFLDGSAIHFNQNLDVLVGGRGTGKSTVIESLRYVLGLEPLGVDALKAHEGIVKNVLRNGTKISLLVRSYRPNEQEYLIERTIPNPPVIRVRNGDILNLTPSAIVPQVEVFGQHEISELAKSPEKRTRLLERFVERDAGVDQNKAAVRRQLEQSRAKIIDLKRELLQVEERLAALPGLEETLKRFQDAGLEERLKEQSLLVREEQIFKTAAGRLTPYRNVLEELRQRIPIDRTFVSLKALDDLPDKEILAEIESLLLRFNSELDSVAKRMQAAIDAADHGLASVKAKWEICKKEGQAAYEKILRELQKSKVDGEEFIRLRRQIEELRPLRERQSNLRQSIKEYEDRRRNLLAEWEDVKAEEFRQLERAAKKVSKQLSERVRVRVTFAGNREPLIQLLKERVGGRLSETLDILRKAESLSLKELSDTWRSGRDALVQKYKLPAAQADRLAQTSSEVVMQLEELDLAPTTQIELNVAAEGRPSEWQKLEDLSTGQKATAVLLLLLLESNAPLVVDQPEDDLDNRFITEGVVPKMREEKQRRQFVFATHNANIPVLGDAELIVGLTASGEAGQEGRARIPREHMGSIDSRLVRELVEEVLEGGREAFEMRRLKYGF